MISMDLASRFIDLLYRQKVYAHMSIEIGISK